LQLPDRSSHRDSGGKLLGAWLGPVQRAPVAGTIDIGWKERCSDGGSQIEGFVESLKMEKVSVQSLGLNWIFLHAREGTRDR